MNNPSIKSRLSNIFLKKGREWNFTKLFSNLPEAGAAAILAASKISGEELPMIADFRNATEWSLITTNRVVWHDSNGVHSVPVSEITQVGIDLERIQTPPPKPTTDRLGIRTKPGQLIEVQFEPGPPLFGAWNALRFFSVQNHKDDHLDERAKALATELRDNPARAQRHLESWEVETIKNLCLERFP